MRTAKVQRLRAGALCLPALLLLLVAQLRAGPMCGPGDRWIDTCSAGTSALWAIATLTLDLDGSGPRGVPLEGVLVLRNGPPSGGVMDTEIVQMDLTGNSPTFGAVHLRAGRGLFHLPPCGGRPSVGRATQDPVAPGYAESFFDVFFEIDITPSGGDALRLCNPDDGDALHLSARVDRWPPMNVEMFANPVLVVDEDDDRRGTAGLALTLVPEPSSLVLAVGAAALIFFLHRRKPL